MGDWEAQKVFGNWCTGILYICPFARDNPSDDRKSNSNDSLPMAPVWQYSPLTLIATKELLIKLNYRYQICEH